MSFDVAAESYDRFMGRYSRGLSAPLSDLAGVTRGQRMLDVGCGPGALTGELVARVGATNVAAVDPSTPFVEAARARHPGVDVRQAAAEALPFETATFDGALAQLVIHFLPDPLVGVREMARVTRPGGVIAACVWDHASDRGPLGVYWHAARSLDPGIRDESILPGVKEGDLLELFRAAGLRDVRQTTIETTVEHPSFEEWWEPFTKGVGPAGAYVATLDAPRRAALEARCREALPAAPFSITARAWAAVGRT
jgi:SAM-dependent methyltransferase